MHAIGRKLLRSSEPRHGNKLMRIFNRHLYLLAAILVSLSACVHVAANPITGPDGADTLRMYEYLLIFLMVVWLIKDPKLSKADRPSFDHGFLHMVLFPLLATYEQFVTRRWKGLAIVLGLLMLLFAPFLTMVILFSVN